MANSRDLGHAMRRRMGTPSSYTESLEPAGARTMPTLDEHYEMAKQKDSSRVSLGDGPIDTPHEVMSDEQAAPTNLPVTKAVASSVKPSRNGAAYTVTAHTTHLADPTHGPTTAQGRIVSDVRVQIADEIGAMLDNLSNPSN
jgi:hypothetical protein